MEPVFAVVLGAMVAVGASGPDRCGREQACRETWRGGMHRVELRVVEDRSANAHAADQDAGVSIFLRGTSGWFETHVSWLARDIEMSTVRTKLVTRRHVATGALADGRPVVVVQIDFREDGADRAPRKPWPTAHSAVIVACVADRTAPACTIPIWADCRERCEDARVRRGVLSWRDRSGRRRETLAAP